MQCDTYGVSKISIELLNNKSKAPRNLMKQWVTESPVRLSRNLLLGVPDRHLQFQQRVYIIRMPQHGSQAPHSIPINCRITEKKQKNLINQNHQIPNIHGNLPSESWGDLNVTHAFLRWEFGRDSQCSLKRSWVKSGCLIVSKINQYYILHKPTHQRICCVKEKEENKHTLTSAVHKSIYKLFYCKKN